MTAKRMSCRQNTRQVLLLQRVEEVCVPVIEPDRQTDLRALGSYDSSENGASNPRFLDAPGTEWTELNCGLFIRGEVGGRQPPYCGDLLLCLVQHSATTRLGKVVLPGRARSDAIRRSRLKRVQMPRGRTSSALRRNRRNDPRRLDRESHIATAPREHLP